MYACRRVSCFLQPGIGASMSICGAVGSFLFLFCGFVKVHAKEFCLVE